MITLAAQFGGLEARREPHLIGPTAAQDLSNVNLDTDAIQAQLGPGSVVTSGGGTLASIYKFGGTWILDTAINWQYAEMDGVLYRAASGRTPQKSTNGSSWSNLGVQPPLTALTAAVGAAGALTGDYTYVVTFVASDGSESGPSPISNTVTLAAERASLSAIPIGYSTGDTNGTTTVANVTNIDRWAAGMFIAGTNIPAGASVVSVGVSSLVISAAATGTTAGGTLRDPQVTARNIYRTGGTDEFQLVAQLADVTTTTYSDNIADVALGDVLTTDGYTTPGTLDGIAATPYGVLFGWRDTRWLFTEPSLPNSWPVSYFRDFVDPIVGATAATGVIFFITEGKPYIVTGRDALTFGVEQIDSEQQGLHRDTLIDMGSHGTWFLSPDGVCRFDGTAASPVSRADVSDSIMAAITASSARGVRFNERFILFHSGGWLEWTSDKGGGTVGSRWRKGALTGTQVACCHYNRTDDVLYVGVGADVRAWEAGSALTYTYRTGDWSGKAPQILKEFFRLGVQHNGSMTAQVYIDGVAAGSPQALVRSTLGLSVVWCPLGAIGHRLSVSLSGTGKVIALLADMAELRDFWANQ